MKNIKILTANDTVNDCFKIEPNEHSDTDLAWLTELADKFPAEELQKMYNSIKARREKEDAELFVDKAVEKQIPISPSNKAYCRSCGLKLSGSENFCSNCGQKLNWKGQEFDLLFDDLIDELNLIEIETSVPKVLIYPNFIYFKQ
jgi:hypothetical protein